MKTGTQSHAVVALALCLAAVLLSGCRVGPNYRRPALNTPDAFRASATDTTDLAAAESLANLGWWQVLNDPQLQAYIAEALTNSWDIQIAAARVLQAEAVARVTRSQFFPTVGAGADWATTRASENGPSGVPSGVNPQKEYGSVYGTMAGYEVDLWGRIRRANEAARAQLLATEAAQQTVRQTLVAQVATAYLSLLELDYELEIAERTYAVRTNSLALTQARQEGGVASMQDVYQAQILVATAEAAIADTHRRIEQQENELSILLGSQPRLAPAGRGLPAAEARRHGAARLAVRSDRAPAGHPCRGTATRGRQRRHRPGQGRLLPEGDAHRVLRVPVRGAFRSLQERVPDVAVRAGGVACRCSPVARCAAT